MLDSRDFEGVWATNTPSGADCNSRKLGVFRRISPDAICTLDTHSGTFDDRPWPAGFCRCFLGMPWPGLDLTKCLRKRTPISAACRRGTALFLALVVTMPCHKVHRSDMLYNGGTSQDNRVEYACCHRPVWTWHGGGVSVGIAFQLLVPQTGYGVTLRPGFLTTHSPPS